MTILWVAPFLWVAPCFYYLSQQRSLSTAILASLIDQGKFYADARSNAVFVMQAGKPNRPIGGELRGTGPRVWRALAPGTSENAGYLWIGDPSSQHIVLCESAIDAIRCHQLNTGCRVRPLANRCHPPIKAPRPLQMCHLPADDSEWEVLQEVVGGGCWLASLVVAGRDCHSRQAEIFRDSAGDRIRDAEALNWGCKR